jgi:hypothetical protein
VTLPPHSAQVKALIRIDNTGAAQCEAMAEYVGQQGLKEAGVEQMSLIYSMLMSVDGYVEDEHGRFDFAAPDEEVNLYINQITSSIGTYLFGRRMYVARESPVGFIRVIPSRLE